MGMSHASMRGIWGMVGRCLPAVVVAAGLGLVLSVALASAAGGTDITGTWTCCGAGGAGAQQWVITDSSGRPSGSGLEGTSVFATISGSVSGNSVTIVTTYTQDVGYVATFVGTVSADGTTMSGSWTSNQHQSGTWTATAPGKRSSAVGVNCYTVDPGEPTEYLQCTAAVADASGQQTADTPTGTVAFAINAGGTGGFQGSSACALLPSQTGGPTSYCSVNYVPPSGGLALGAQPPITATYSGDKTFAPSSGQPLTLQAVEQQDCSAAFNPGCVGVDLCLLDLRRSAFPLPRARPRRSARLLHAARRVTPTTRTRASTCLTTRTCWWPTRVARRRSRSRHAR